MTRRLALALIGVVLALAACGTFPHGAPLPDHIFPTPSAFCTLDPSGAPACDDE